MRDTTRFSICALVAIAALAGVVAAINQGVHPVWALLIVLLLPCMAIALAKFPAAFIPPILFISQGMPMPANPYRRILDPTELTLGAVLLALAIFFRLIKLSTREKGLWLGDLFKGQGKGIAFYFLFAAALTVSFLWTRAPGYGGSKLVSFLIVGTLCFIAPFIVMIEERDLRHFTLATVALALILSLSRVSGVSQGTYAEHYQPVHIGIGQLIGMAILLVLYLGLFEEPWIKNLLILALPILAAGLIASETRDALFSLILVLLGGVFFRPQRVGYITPLIALGGCAVIVAALLIVPGQWIRGYAAQRFREKSVEVVQMVRGTSTDKGSGGRRLVFYRAALDGFAQKPLWGWGVGGWETYYWHNDQQDPPEYPHFELLEVGVEEGLLGLIPFVIFLIIGLRAAKKAFYEESSRYAFVLPILVYCLLLTTASGDVDDNRFVWLWCGIAFVACRIIDSKRQEVTQLETAADS
ncbi:MAG: O-antigen ligase family protein [Acidobacteria bacterium]|nr:MAG: O-antigen ligase family protein [Acidobacteriota bacterium]